MQPNIRKNATTNYTELDSQFPVDLVNKKVGRFSNSPHSLNSTLNKQREELMNKFNTDHEMKYLQHQVRRMESPDFIEQT